MCEPTSALFGCVQNFGSMLSVLAEFIFWGSLAPEHAPEPFFTILNNFEMYSVTILRVWRKNQNDLMQFDEAASIVAGDVGLLCPSRKLFWGYAVPQHAPELLFIISNISVMCYVTIESNKNNGLII